jgi:hypothetical protein
VTICLEDDLKGFKFLPVLDSVKLTRRAFTFLLGPDPTASRFVLDMPQPGKYRRSTTRTAGMQIQATPILNSRSDQYANGTKSPGRNVCQHDHPSWLLQVALQVGFHVSPSMIKL